MPANGALERVLGSTTNAAQLNQKTIRALLQKTESELVKLEGKTAVELNAAIHLEELESTITGAHFHSRHGAGTTLAQQQIRAQTGMTPDGVQKNPVDASRFLTYEQELKALQLAEAHFQLTGETAFNISMPEIIGEGYLIGGTVYKTTNTFRAFYKNGKIITLFPKLQ